jgi:hypothetical protein
MTCPLSPVVSRTKGIGTRFQNRLYFTSSAPYAIFAPLTRSTTYPK